MTTFQPQSTPHKGTTMNITPNEAKRIAKDAYIFAYPMLENY